MKKIGEIIKQIGECSVGTKVNGKIHGPGLKINKNNNDKFSFSIGLFNNGYRQGEGLVIQESGEFWEGVFEDGN